MALTWSSRHVLDELAVLVEDQPPPRLAEELVLEFAGEVVELSLHPGLEPKLHGDPPRRRPVEMEIAAIDEDVRGAIDGVERVELLVELDHELSGGLRHGEFGHGRSPAAGRRAPRVPRGGGEGPLRRCYWLNEIVYGLHLFPVVIAEMRVTFTTTLVGGVVADEQLPLPRHAVSKPGV